MTTNLDNVSGELLGHVCARLMSCGALDASMTPLTMKKGRPGWALQVMASTSKTEMLENLIFTELPTLGIRKKLVQRSILQRSEAEIKHNESVFKAKKIFELDGEERVELEFDEKIRLAEKLSLPVRKL
ncbi:MAG: nickel insertion protein [Candidatus Rifleibacteriota bacterium]